MKTLKLLIAIFAIFSIAGLPSSIYAHPGSPEHVAIDAEAAKKKAELQAEMAQKRAEFEKKRIEAKNIATTKQDEAKKKSCENRAAGFKKRMENITERSERRIEVFNKISERVQRFADEKGVVVPNKEQLQVDIELKKDALVQAHELTKENASVFQCDGDNAKTNATIYKEAIAKEHQAFKDYKDSIKNLIKAVKQALEASKPGETNE